MMKSVLIIAFFTVYYMVVSLLADDSPASTKTVAIPLSQADHNEVDAINKEVEVINLRLENIRLRVCLINSVPSGECGRIDRTAMSVERVIAAKPDGKSKEK